jgi:hypothetical protein
VRIIELRTDEVSTKIVDDVLAELIILLNQNHTNHLLGHDDIKKVIHTVVRRLQQRR